MKKILLCFLLGICAFSFIACNDEKNPDDSGNPNNGGNNTTTVTIDITETSIDLEVGETHKFNLDIEIKMESSNPNVVSCDVVNKSITAIGEGEATITIIAKANETVTKSIAIVVTDPNKVIEPIKPATIEISIPQDSMYLNSEMQFEYTVLPEGADQSVEFSFDKNVIDLDSETLTIYSKSSRKKVNVIISSTVDPTIKTLFSFEIKSYINPDEFFSTMGIENPVVEKITAYGWQVNGNWEATLNGSITKYAFEKPLKAVQNLLPANDPTMEPATTVMKPRFIVFHDTADGLASANASYIANYCKTAPDASWHYTIDDGSIIQSVPLDRVAWHAGCGTDTSLRYTDTKIIANGTEPATVTISADGYFEMNGQKTTIKAPLTDENTIPTNDNIPYTGIENYVDVKTGTYWIGNTWWSSKYKTVGNLGGNLEGIGIESCVNNGSNVWKTWINAAKFIGSYLLIETDLTPKDVRQHNTFSGKDCPMTMRHANKWENFIELITYEYGMAKYFSDFDVEFICDSPYINANGTIKNLPTEPTEITYSIKVSYDKDNYEKTFDFKVLLTNTYTENFN